jgi:hypothetical protein
VSNLDQSANELWFSLNLQEQKHLTRDDHTAAIIHLVSEDQAGRGHFIDGRPRRLLIEDEFGLLLLQLTPSLLS